MKRALTVGFLVLAPSMAFACGGAKTASAANTDEATYASAAHTTDADVDPTHCAKQSGLVGANCSYSTGMMAQRVLEEGQPYTFTGSLAQASNDLDSKVAAPFAIGPQDGIHVVANAVLEDLIDHNQAKSRLEMTGRLLKVDGVQYFVATAFEAINS